MAAKAPETSPTKFGLAMPDQIVRMECLKLAVTNGSAARVSDPIAIAQKYFDWVTWPPKTNREPTGKKKNSEQEGDTKETTLKLT